MHYANPSIARWLHRGSRGRVAERRSLDLTMPHPKKIVLHCRSGYTPRLDTLVEEFIRDGVIFVGVVGEDCAKVEDIIDETRSL